MRHCVRANARCVEGHSETTVAAHAAQGTVRDELKSSALSLVRHIFVRIIKGHLAAAVAVAIGCNPALTTGPAPSALQDKVAAEGERGASGGCASSADGGGVCSSELSGDHWQQTVEQLEKELADSVHSEEQATHVIAQLRDDVSQAAERDSAQSQAEIGRCTNRRQLRQCRR